MSVKSIIATFGRRAPASRARALGGFAVPDLHRPPCSSGEIARQDGTLPDGSPNMWCLPAPPCGFGDYIRDAPDDEATKKPSTIGNGVRAGLELAGILAAGAVIGAVVSKEKRGRNAAIGGGAGAVIGAGVVYYQYGKWKDDGGKTHVKGGCDGTPPPQQAPSKGKSQQGQQPGKGAQHPAVDKQPPAVPPPVPAAPPVPWHIPGWKPPLHPDAALPKPPTAPTTAPTFGYQTFGPAAPPAPTFTPGAYCTTPDGRGYGVFDVNGNCVQAPHEAGDDCTMPDGQAGYLDSYLTCTAFAPMQVPVPG